MSDSPALPKVGIIGCGVVGWAIRPTLTSDRVSLVATYDKHRWERNENADRMNETDLVFVCVPSPTPPNSLKQDQSALLEVVTRLAGDLYQGVVVIKSTVVPGTMDALRARFPSLRLAHYPEFLCAKTAVEDYRSQEVVLLSGRIQDCMTVRSFLEATISVDRVCITQHFYATEHAKYLHNCALAIQLSFLNEVYEAIGDSTIFQIATEMAAEFGNLGRLHAVPGPDGQRGWGGMCFPKDTKAYLGHTERDMPTLRGAITTNQRLRPREME